MRAGDTTRVEMEIIDKKETSSPGQGIIRHKSSCANQRGEILVEAESTHLVKRKA